MGRAATRFVTADQLDVRRQGRGGRVSSFEIHDKAAPIENGLLDFTRV
jgi:hypothetical protein